MLRSAFREYVDEVSPNLSAVQREKLARGLFKMTLGWATQPEKARSQFLQSAQSRIVEEMLAKPVSFHLELRCSDRGRATSVVQELAEQYLRKLVKNTAKHSPNVGKYPPPKKVPQFHIEHAEKLSSRFVTIRSRITGTNLSERNLRRAAALSIRGHKRLRLAGMVYKQLALFEEKGSSA